MVNGSFEKGSLEGWTKEGNIGDVSWETVYWNEQYSYEKEGSYFFSGWRGNESDTGSLLSSPFLVNETAKLTFRLGGMKNSDVTYLSLIEEGTGNEVARFGNPAFHDTLRFSYFAPEFGKHNILSEDGVYMANMKPYVADLTPFKGKTLRIRLVDNASSDWGLFFADDFHCAYASEEEVPSYESAVNIL